MSQTAIPAGSPLARKVFGAALFAATQRTASKTNTLTGNAPAQSAAEAKLKLQSTPDMPFVRVTDLTKSAGDKVSVDLINTIGGAPIMGDRDAEGSGEKLSFSTQELAIDLTTKVVDVGGKMSQQRTVHQLRGLGMSGLVGWFDRFGDQTTLVHLAGARGTQGVGAGMDWVIPAQSDASFSEIMVNPVLAPTYNRHYVADGTAIVQGGQQLGSIDSTDVFRLEHVDALATVIADGEVKLQPVKLPGDPQADNAALYVMWISQRMYNSIQTNTTNTVWRTMVQNAWNRASGFKHPLFAPDDIMWRNILIKPIDRAIRFTPGSSAQIITAANRYTATESAQTVNAGLGAGFAVDRGLLMGAQALAHVYGRNAQSDTVGAWMERPYNFGRSLEIAGDIMGGKSKLRFSLPDGQGNTEPTDHGVFVLDATVAL